MNHALPVALVALLASGCVARETQERPVTAASGSSAPSLAPSPPSPLPESAFRGDEPSRGTSPAPPSRFDTRRIGASDDDSGDPSAARRFHGAPVDIDLKGADLANVFRLLADVGHVDIVVDGAVSGAVTLRLKHVPWDQALDLVARTHGLELRREGTVIVVRAAGSEHAIAAARAIGDP